MKETKTVVCLEDSQSWAFCNQPIKGDQLINRSPQYKTRSTNYKENKKSGHCIN